VIINTIVPRYWHGVGERGSAVGSAANLTQLRELQEYRELFSTYTGIEGIQMREQNTMQHGYVHIATNGRGRFVRWLVSFNFE